MLDNLEEFIPTWQCIINITYDLMYLTDINKDNIDAQLYRWILQYTYAVCAIRLTDLPDPGSKIKYCIQ